MSDEKHSALYKIDMQDLSGTFKNPPLNNKVRVKPTCALPRKTERKLQLTWVSPPLLSIWAVSHCHQSGVRPPTERRMAVRPLIHNCINNVIITPLRAPKHCEVNNRRHENQRVDSQRCCFHLLQLERCLSANVAKTDGILWLIVD